MNFLLFAGRADDHSKGGFADFVGDFETVAAATEYARELIADNVEWAYFNPDWWHVVDIELRRIVASGDRNGDHERVGDAL